jgi:hypothetical protein
LVLSVRTGIEVDKMVGQSSLPNGVKYVMRWSRFKKVVLIPFRASDGNPSDFHRNSRKTSLSIVTVEKVRREGQQMRGLALSPCSRMSLVERNGLLASLSRLIWRTFLV